MLKLVDIFAGCGGMTSGFVGCRLGAVDGPVFEPIFAIEHDKDAAATYALNFGAHVEVRPIEQVASTEFPGAHVVIGGPPCQGFSALNRNRDGDLRRQLWREYERALRATRASYFVMENVPQLIGSSELADFRSELGDEWKLTEAVLNAADYGVPQVRRRAIVIGSRLGEVPLPNPTHERHLEDASLRLVSSIDRSLPGWRTVRDAIGHLPPEPTGHDWHTGRNPTETSLIRYKHVPPEGGRFDMQEALDAEGLGHLVPSCWRRKTTGTTDVFGRMRWKEPAPTIRTEFYKPEKGRYLHPEAHRPITIREGALLMSFPTDFSLIEEQSLTSVGRQVGNAVPPKFAEAIAAAVAGHAREHGLLVSGASTRRAA
jgi:DNA (cytosine-5)-methyltransferase 1